MLTSRLRRNTYPFDRAETLRWSAVLAGNKARSAWAVGLFNQGLWLAWIASTRKWGLLPMNVALWIVYARNHMKWDREGQSS